MNPAPPKSLPTPTAPKPSSPAEEDSATSPSATFALILAPFVAVLSLMVFGPFLPSMAADLDTTVGLLGQIPALMNLVTALMAFIVGPIADHYGFRRVLLLGVLCMTLYVAGMSLAPTYLMLLLVSFVGAVGRPALTSVPLAYAGTHFHGAARQQIVSWTSAGMSGAGIIGIPILTAIAAAYDWRAAFALLAAVSLVIGAIMWRALPADSASHPDGATSPTSGSPLGARRLRAAYSPLLRHRPTMGIVLATGFGAAMMFTVLTYIGALVTQRYGYSVQEVGWVFFAISVAFLGGSLLAGGRVGRLPLRAVLITTRGLSGILVGVAFAFSLPALAAVGLTMLGVLANGVSNVCTTLLLTGETPGGRATTMTLNSLTVNLGGALGGSLGGLLLTTAGFPALGLSAAIFGLAGVALVWWSRP